LGDGTVGTSVGGQQANARSQDDPLRRCLRIYPSLQGPSLLRRHGQDRGWFPHALSVTQTIHNCKDITETLH